ncbi:MAG: hypothetical protein JWQ43_2189 [Glaciihabitans sp.]|nr:hypothetical protein [Glaciihabitans sp.]
MRRTPALSFSALALVLAFGVTGCSAGSSDSDSSPGGTTAPSSESSSAAETTAPSEVAEVNVDVATGATVVGDGYSYSIPEGWAEEDASLAPGTDTIALDSAPTGAFATNVNVLLSPAGAVTSDQVEGAAQSELEGSGATEVAILDRVTVAGSESAHVSAVLASDEVTYRIHQYYATNNDQTYVITFSFPEETADADATGLADSVLATWSWS